MRETHCTVVPVASMLSLVTTVGLPEIECATMRNAHLRRCAVSSAPDAKHPSMMSLILSVVVTTFSVMPIVSLHRIAVVVPSLIAAMILGVRGYVSSLTVFDLLFFCFLLFHFLLSRGCLSPLPLTKALGDSICAERKNECRRQEKFLHIGTSVHDFQRSYC